MTKHNKKRNVGIVYELLLNYISNNLIEGKKNNAKKATKIIERHFRKNSELYKEFRLFNAIAQTTASDTHIVASILGEAKNAVRNNIDHNKLEIEKSKLIKEINYALGKDFYYNNIENYRDLGVIQMAINEWKNKNPDIKKLIDFESKIGEMMLNKSVKEPIKENLDASHSDKLVLKIMTEKFNQRYGEDLTKDQKTIIENYVFYSDKNSKYLTTFFENKKNQALKNLEEFEDKSNNKYLLRKLDEVKEKIKQLTTEISDENVMKYLSVTKLIEEIRKGV